MGYFKNLSLYGRRYAQRSSASSFKDPHNAIKLEREIDQALEKLYKIPATLRPKTRKKILRKAAAPLKAAARARVKVGKQPHHRYLNGEKVATYYPGNLKRSIHILTFRKSKSAVFVGPRLKKGNTSGEFGADGNKLVDGYYGHFLEYGTDKQRAQPYMRPAADQTKSQVVKIVTDEVTKLLKELTRKM